MVIDYGHPARAGAVRPRASTRRPAADLSPPSRRRRSYRSVGRQDLTAHVDWTTLELAGRGRRAGGPRPDDPGRGAQRPGPGDRLVELQAQPGHDGRGLCPRPRVGHAPARPASDGWLQVLLLRPWDGTGASVAKPGLPAPAAPAGGWLMRFDIARERLERLPDCAAARSDGARSRGPGHGRRCPGLGAPGRRCPIPRCRCARARLPGRGRRGDLILTARPEGDLRHAGQVSFPGGAVDPGDDFPDGTAMREAGGRRWASMPRPRRRPDRRTAGGRRRSRLRLLLVPVVALADRVLVLTPDPREVARHPARARAALPARCADRDRRGRGGTAGGCATVPSRSGSIACGAPRRWVRALGGARG